MQRVNVLDRLCVVEIDASAEGVRFVDSFLWDVESPLQPEEFAGRTVADLGLPLALSARIAQQARHQISAYQSLRREFVVPSTAKCPIKIEISIRHGAVDYSDSFLWDWRAPTSPEEFAARTISDLGLPLQMIQAVAAQIRMQTLAALMGVEEKPAPTATAEAAGAGETVAGPTVKPVATQSYSDVMADVHAQATIPQPTQLPRPGALFSNAAAWATTTTASERAKEAPPTATSSSK